MKSKIQFTVPAFAILVLAGSALAQDNYDRKLQRPNNNQPYRTHAPSNRLNGAAKASDVVGMTVKNYQDEKIGSVEEVAVDVESGRIVQVIVSVGGFLGMGDTLTAVPPGAFHFDATNKVLHLDTDKETLKRAPKFEMSKWADYSDSEHLSAVYRHYGETDSFRFISKNDAANTVSSRRPDGTWEHRLSDDSQSMIPASRLGLIQKASKVIGASVKNLQDEKLGKVENLLLDLVSGRIVAVVVSSGGFLGMGDELSAIPPTALRFTADRDDLQLDASKETLSNAPHFKSNQWPDFNEPGYTHGVYRAYRVDPYFTTNVNTDVDNTARNVRDRNERTLTPLDQGTAKSDVSVTTQIRKEIMSRDNLSVNAHNVKIITVAGNVTLRGPVNTAEEKRIIGEIAERFIISGKVDNQLEVKTTTSSTY